MEFLRKFFRLFLVLLLPALMRRWYRWESLFVCWVERGELFISEAVRFNLPVQCDGIGSLYIHENVSLGYRRAPRMGSGKILLQAREKRAVIRIGAETSTSNNISIVARERIEIGRRCLIGDMVSIMDSDFHEILPEKRHDGGGGTSPVIIGDNVWLGSRVQVLKGVTIGDNSVIAAGSVVTKSIPPRSLAAGIPAKVIKTL